MDAVLCLCCCCVSCELFAASPSINHNVCAAYQYATFCSLVSINPHDHRAAMAPAALMVPAVDSIDQWPSLLIPNASQSARHEVPLSLMPASSGKTCSNNTMNAIAMGGSGGNTASNSSSSTMNNCALLMGDLKLVTGSQNLLGFWQGPRYPNASSIRVALNLGCPYGCLFNIRDDPSELHDLKSEEPGAFASMMARLAQLEKGVWSSNTTTGPRGVYSDCITNKTEYHYAWSGYRGPACSLSLQHS
eukprot:COSAG02_NODE_2831_length_7935_cov_5.630296_6_plen_247_part_00